MIFRCWRCGTWGWKIRHVCDDCFRESKWRVHELAKELEAKRNG